MDVIWTKEHIELIADTLLYIVRTNPSEIVYKENEKTVTYKDVFVSQWGKNRYLIVVAGNSGTYGPRMFFWFAFSELRKMNKVFSFVKRRAKMEVELAKELDMRMKIEKANSVLTHNLSDLIDKAILDKKK